MGITAPQLLDVMAGSAEGLIRKCSDAAGNPRLFSPDELGHLLEKAQIQNASFPMRHGAASALLADGASPALVQKQLRHSDPRITLQVYAHVLGDQQRTAVQNRSARLVN